ncbi:MAG: TetR/AcrR family transcriptional regulator, partial [Dietzia maris]
MTRGSTWSARPSGPRTGRLSAGDWARAGLDLLMTEGRSAVKISRLCADFGVTKGSFYWHFADFDALMAAIARLYFSQEMDAARGLVTMEEMPPDAR